MRKIREIKVNGRKFQIYQNLGFARYLGQTGPVPKLVHFWEGEVDDEPEHPESFQLSLGEILDDLGDEELMKRIKQNASRTELARRR